MKGSDDVSGLMSSIKQLGLLQPIAVTKDGDEYRIIYGNRRFDAYKKLGYSKIPCIVKTDMDDIREVKENLAENTARKAITGSELYKYILHLSNSGLNDKEIASNLGLSVSRIYHIRKAGKTLKMEYLDKLEVDFPDDKKGKSKGRPKKLATSISSNLITKLVVLKKSYGTIYTSDVVDHIIKKHGKINPKNLFGYVKFVGRKRSSSTPALFDNWLNHMLTRSVQLSVQYPVKDIEKFGIKTVTSKLRKDMVKAGLIPKEGNL
jgi:DNA-binding CsgD family transcriptional regulator